MFPTDYPSIIQKIEAIDVVAYAKTRNFSTGAVSRLSPYISRGVITTSFVKAKVLEKHTVSEAYAFIFELAWREYFQRVWLREGDKILTDLKHEQSEVMHRKIPSNVLKAQTGINAIDAAIHELYNVGYMHNHLRMYVASICCNVGKAHWLEPAKWMYYHLLDGDPASNFLSWQWVAGTFSNKKYLCNQDNINKYTHSNQRNTFLDKTYEQVAVMHVPQQLKETTLLPLQTRLPDFSLPKIDERKPVLMYHPFSLNPLWRNYMDANKILLLEPDFFSRFPVSEKVMDFYLGVSKNIEGIQVFTGNFSEWKTNYPNAKVFFQSHPAFSHWQGTADEPEWMFPEVRNAGSSFMNFWKQCEKWL